MDTLSTIIGSIVAFFGVWLILILIGYLFWVWMFMDALAHRDVMWIVLFAFSFFTGFLPGVIAAVYYTTVYRRETEHFT